jgi:nitroreductase
VRLTVAALSVPAAIAARRSVKHFRPDPIDEGTMEQLIELTLAAPSSWNLQPWRIVLVRGDEPRRALHQAAFRQAQIIEAPVTFVFAVEPMGWERDLPDVVTQARATGAWSAAYCDFAEQAAPRGLDALRGAGLLREHAIKDAMIAATHTALAAQSLGLGSTFMNGWVESEVKRAIGAAERPELAIAVLLPVGYPLEVPKSPGRLPRERTVSIDRIG